jgi:polysaccharide export outer membrane protein
VAGERQPVDQIQADPASLPALRISSGDLLEISVYGVPELKQKTRVDERGSVSMPLIGAVAVSGLTVGEAQAELEKKLTEGGYLRNPNVTVLVVEYATQGASVLGEVAKPGIYPVLGERRLFDLISAAGGLTDRAGKLITVTRRDRPKEPINLNLTRDPAQSPEVNIEVQPGDTIVVSKAGLVYVVGEVGHPSGFIMENNENMTVLQAIAMANGVTAYSALDAAKLIRRTSSGPQEIPIPLKKILTAQAADVSLQPEDIVFVPRRAGKRAVERTVEAILQVATGLAIYGR